MEQMTVREIVAATGGRLLCGDAAVPLKHISIDSRRMKGEDLFVPIVGERADAHDFIEQACENGAKAVLTSRHDQMDSKIPYIRVEDTKEALQDIGRYYRGRLGLPLVGITGSVGKTTTREMVAAALSAGFQVYKTPANHNSQVGVPITLSEIGPADQIGVIELGMSEPGELTVIARIAQVDMAVITNIGVTHIEQLGSQENIYREKLSIQDGLKPGGVLFLNGDDALLKKTEARKGFRTIYFGMGAECQYRAEDVHLEEGLPVFTAVHVNERVPVKLKAMGIHNVQNAMVALAVAAENGIPMEIAAVPLSEFTGFDNRQQICRTGGITVIDDTYNASPASMKAAIDVLCSLTGVTERIAVLADMKELGSQAPFFHYEVGTYAAEHQLDEVVTLGEVAKEIARGVKDSNPATLTISFLEKQQLIDYLKRRLTKGVAVLFKGSNSMKLGQVAAAFMQGNRDQ